MLLKYHLIGDANPRLQSETKTTVKSFYTIFKRFTSIMNSICATKESYRTPNLELLQHFTFIKESGERAQDGGKGLAKERRDRDNENLHITTHSMLISVQLALS